MTSKYTKSFSSRMWIAGAALAGGLAPLALQVYRHPLETFNALLRAGMRLSGVRDATCDLNGLSMHYYFAGKPHSPPVILLHGLGNSAEVWTSLFPLLSDIYRVYAPELPGFGNTPLAPEGVNIRTHVLYLERFLQASGHERVVLVGNSLGGWIATQFAVEHPEQVEHLFLLNSAGLRREQMHSPYAVDRVAAQESMDRIWGHHLPLPNFLLDAIVRVSQMPAYANFIHSYDIKEELDDVLSLVHVPTTIIWGTRDGIFPLTCAHDFHAGIANSRLVLLPEIGHMPQVQAAFQIARIIRTDN